MYSIYIFLLNEVEQNHKPIAKITQQNKTGIRGILCVDITTSTQIKVTAATSRQNNLNHIFIKNYPKPTSTIIAEKDVTVNDKYP